MDFRVIPKNTLAKAKKEELLGRQEKDVSSDEYDKNEDAYIDKRMFREKMGLSNEVKKVGVIIDRGQKMEFRGGDIMLIYVSMGGFEKWVIPQESGQYESGQMNLLWSKGAVSIRSRKFKVS